MLLYTHSHRWLWSLPSLIAFIAFPVVVVFDVWAPSIVVVFVVTIVGTWVVCLEYLPSDRFLFFCCRSMASVLFVVWAAVYLTKAVSKDIGVRGGGMALFGSMMERWDGFGIMMDGGMADDAATTIAVSPTPPGAADASLPPAAFRGTWTMGEDDAAPNPMPPNPGG